MHGGGIRLCGHPPMKIALIFRTALLALRRSLLRTCLTVLGLVIGVAAVITIVSLGQGARASIQEEVEGTGTNLIIVSAGNWTQGGSGWGWAHPARSPMRTPTRFAAFPALPT